MLTFEKIRDLERAERESRQLQKLPENLFSDVRDYLRKKDGMKTSKDLQEIENMRNTVQRFFELREKKIVEFALYAVRTGMPVENLTKEEERLFFFLVDEMKRFRETFFANIAREEERKERKIVFRVRKSIPAFVGPDMQTYRLNAGDVVSLPKPLNDLLLKEGVIEQVEE